MNAINGAMPPLTEDWADGQVWGSNNFSNRQSSGSARQTRRRDPTAVAASWATKEAPTPVSVRCRVWAPGLTQKYLPALTAAYRRQGHCKRPRF